MTSSAKQITFNRLTVEALNCGLCGAQKCRGNPCDCPVQRDCPIVDETIRELSVRRWRWDA